MQTMKKALTSAGLEEEKVTKDIVRYKVLHIPTASYLYGFDSKTNSFKVLTFVNKAKAGHARDDYRLQRFKTRSYSGNGLFLEGDIREAQEQKGIANRFQYHQTSLNVWQIQNQIRERIKAHGHFYKEEFELIPIEDSDANTMSLDS